MIGAAVSKATLSGMSTAVKSVGCVIGKQALDTAAKKAFEQLLPSALSGTLDNLTELEQAILALELSPDEAEVLESFFSSAAFQSFIRSAGFITGIDPESLALTRAALSDSLARLVDKRRGTIDSLGTAVIEYLKIAAERAFNTAAELGLLGSSWSADAMVQSLVADEVTNARNQVEQRIASNAAQLLEIEIFVGRYKRKMAQATSMLRPQSVNDSPAVPIERLYVEPFVDFSGEQSATTCHRNMLFAASRRSVLLGNPGGGKSTLAAKLCNDICSDALDKTNFDVPRLATQIVLRDYAQQRRQTPCSVIEYLEMHSKSDLQVEAPKNAFRTLLMLGQILVVFDGLDELIEIADRSAVASVVEQFASEYPVAPILVTSREVGYEQAPINRSMFSHFKLSPFIDSQIEEYSQKWFSNSCFPNVEEGKKLASGFMQESDLVPDIRTNPLMLGLLCNLYRQDGYIPKNRPEIYQRCADLLFTKWDRSRGITVKLPMESRLKPAMSFLAHWIYNDEQLQAGVTEEQLVQETSGYLGKWLEDDAEAETIARDFISFFSGRAWVFTDTGSSKTQRLYQFTHRTFLEFFTADELVRLYPNPRELHEHLISKIRTRSWDVVCQLAYQLIVERTRSHNLLTELLCQAAESIELVQRLNVLSFLARTIDLLYPMPPARRAAIRLCTKTVFEHLAFINADQKLRDVALEIMGGVFGASEEASKINASEVESVLVEIVRSTQIPEPSRVLTAHLCLDLDVFHNMSTSPHAPYNAERVKLWQEVGLRVCDKLRKPISEFSKSDSRVARQWWWHGELKCEDLIDRFGPTSVFEHIHFPLSNWYRSPISAALLVWPLDSRFSTVSSEADASWKSHVLSDSASLGNLLLAHHGWKPEMERYPGPFSDTLYQVQSAAKERVLSWPDSKEVCESILVGLAFDSEIAARRPHKTLPPGTDGDGVLQEVVCFWSARDDQTRRAEAHRVIDERTISSHIRESLHRWVEGEVTYLADPLKPVSESAT